MPIGILRYSFLNAKSERWSSSLTRKDYISITPNPTICLPMLYHVDLGELFSLYYKSLAVRTIWKSPYLRFPAVHPHLAIAEGEDFRDYVNSDWSCLTEPKLTKGRWRRKFSLAGRIWRSISSA